MDSDDRTGQTEGVSVLEAAAALGLSEKTIYRYIKAGKLNAAKRKTTTGYEWVVFLSGPVDTPDNSRALPNVYQPPGPPGHPSGLPDSVVYLLERHEQLAAAYGRAMAENAALRAMLQSQATARVPWWRRLFGRGER
jgi:predicted DNA-binding transcriptional regulator AlpA